jgi:transposase
MTHYVGLDMSQKVTAICVVDETGRRLWRGLCTSDPEQIERAVQRHANKARIGIETGPKSPNDSKHDHNSTSPRGPLRAGPGHVTSRRLASSRTLPWFTSLPCRRLSGAQTGRHTVAQPAQQGPNNVPRPNN